MAQVTTDGVEPTSTAEYVQHLAAVWREVYPTLDLSPSTGQAQVIGLLAQSWAQRDLELVALASGIDPATAVGGQLDLLVALLGITRNADETDAALLARYRQAQGRNATGTRDALRSHVLDVDGVADCAVVDNPASSSASVRGLTLPAHSVGVVVRGTAAVADVAAAIARYKPLGIATAGGASANVAHADGSSTAIAYFPVTDVRVGVALTIDSDDGFPSDGADRIGESLVVYFAALALGELHSDQHVRARLLTQVAGFSITTIAYTDASSGDALPNTLALDRQLTLALGDVSVVIT